MSNHQASQSKHSVPMQMHDKKMNPSTVTTADWGRRKHAGILSGLKAALLICFCPTLTLSLAVNMEKYQGDLWHTLDITTMQEHWQDLTYEKMLPMHQIIAAYLAFQVLLYRLCPGGRHSGQYTPAGQLLWYKTNGLSAFIVTYTCFWLGHVYGIFNASFIATHFSTLVAALNIWGVLLTVVVYVKARILPTSVADRVFSGNHIYDLCMGVELNPRIPVIEDIKMFIVGRVGMMIWPLVLTSFAMLQYEKQGYISTAMFAGIALQFEYIIDFFCNEHWYLRTIDIAHDHVGFYITWGCFAWLPTTYTLHAQYMARTTQSVSDSAALIFFLLGTSGYLLFRLSNNQKYHIREMKGQCKVWGKPATFTTARYTTADGATRESILLTCGWWRPARHTNYLGDLILSFSTCATSGPSQFLPWFYAIYMSILLLHRCFRDEARCSKKYGQDWRRHCEEVRWRIIPYVL